MCNGRTYCDFDGLLGRHCEMLDIYSFNHIVVGKKLYGDVVRIVCAHVGDCGCHLVVNAHGHGCRSRKACHCDIMA